MLNLHDVYVTPIIGRLDRTSDDDALRDAARIRTYIHAEKRAAKLAPGRTLPAVARSVLTSIWQTPRIGFHNQAKKSFSAEFRNKLLWAPWSLEAGERWNQTRSVGSLVLEHVTPIDAMWRKLVKLDDDFEDPASDFYRDESGGGRDNHVWEHHASSYLIEFWTVAILTAEQARAIDKYPGLRTTGFEPNPFERYLRAEEMMNADRASGLDRPSFNTSRFIIAGHSDDVTRV